MIDELKDLASQVLHVLDAQKDYFRTRSPDPLARCRELEKGLRDRCEGSIADRPDRGLFDGGGA